MIAEVIARGRGASRLRRMANPSPTATLPAFGALLRGWRASRRLSQLELSLEAGISSRHLSCLETGRARPSREMVRFLGKTLDLPLEAQNALHLAAGFAAPFPQGDLSAAQFQHVRQALDFILRQQEPFPGIVIDGGWDVRLRNTAAQRLFATLHAAYRMEEGRAGNAMHVVFHPGGLRPFILNWEEFAGHLIQILHREAAQGSAAAIALRDDILRYPGLPQRWALPGFGAAPVASMQLRHGDHRLAFFSTFTTFAMPQDAALQQLKIECFYPADDATAAFSRHLATPP